VTREDVQCKSLDSAMQSFAVVDLREVWEYLATLRKLGQIATIHRGIEWQAPFDKDKYVSAKRKAGFRRGLLRLREKNGGEGARNSTKLFSFEPPIGVCYLSFILEHRRGNAFELPWAKPKVIMNAVRRTRGAWRISAIPDYDGLAVYQNFHALWPSLDYSPEVIAALLNSPVASAFIAAYSRGRHVTRIVLRQLPIPDLSHRERQDLERLVSQYTQGVGKLELEGDLERRDARALLLEIDARLLRGYDLPPRLERVLLDLFRGRKRPVSLDFGDYYPADFRPCIPLHEYISDDFKRSTAAEIAKRLKPVKSKAAMDALDRTQSIFAGD
jgi:hypothetical protein